VQPGQTRGGEPHGVGALGRGGPREEVTNPENLTPEKRQQREAFTKRFPQRGQLSAQREALRAIFDDPKSANPGQGRRRLGRWMEQGQRLGLGSLSTFCTTLNNWLERLRTTSAAGAVRAVRRGSIRGFAGSSGGPSGW
jgi:hypothetical protein